MAQDDPIGFLNHLSGSTRMEIMLPSRDWRETRTAFERELDRLHVDGEFSVMLGDESRLTDRSAMFVIHTNSPEIIAYVEERGGQERTPRGQVIDIAALIRDLMGG